MTTQDASKDFKREALPQQIEPYRQEAASHTRIQFERLVPYPFLLYVRSKLWDRSLIAARTSFDDEKTQMATFQYYEGGHSFIHPVRKRQTDPNEPGIVLGRAVTQDIVVPVASISNKHLTFIPPAPGAPNPAWGVIDHGSSNGTWLDEEKLQPFDWVSINDGQSLRLGGNLLAWFFYPGHIWQVLRDPAELKRLVDV